MDFTLMPFFIMTVVSRLFVTTCCAGILRRIDRLRDSKFIRTHPNSTRKLPGAIIIGVKKGGTRALLEFLRIHPGIRATGPEVHYFDKNYRKGLDWYRDQMPPTLPHQITMEKTPSYFITHSAPERIHRMSPRTKLIVVVRDPVTRLLSDYAQVSDRRPALSAFTDLAFLNTNSGVVDSSWTPIKIGQYAKHLRSWLRYFPPEQVHVVSGEEMIKNPSKILVQVQEFLQLPVLLNDQHFVYNKTKGFPCVRKKKKKVHCLAESKGRAHPKISPFLLRRLRSYYRPFNEDFYRLTGRDFGWQ